MPESRVHAMLVSALAKWIIAEHLDGQEKALLTDIAIGRPGEKPPRIPTYSPDAYSKASKAFEVIVGEAKTAIDLENKHTEAQVCEFIAHCGLHKRGLFVMAVPWYATRTAARLVRRVRKPAAEHVVVQILERLPG